MAKIKTRKEKTEIIKKQLLGVGGEPSFSPLSSSKADMTRGLNFYSNRNYTQQNSKEFALDWIKAERPDLLPVLKSAPEVAFENRGFVCRIISRGFMMDEKDSIKHLEFFDSLHAKELKRKQESATDKKDEKKAIPLSRKVLNPPPNPVIEYVEYAIDSVIVGKKDGTLTFPDLSVLKKDVVQEALNRVDEVLADVASDGPTTVEIGAKYLPKKKEDGEQRQSEMHVDPQYSPRVAAGIKKILGQIRQHLTAAVEAPVVRAPRQRKAPSADTVKKKALALDSTLTSTLRIKKEDKDGEELVVRGVSAAALIGKPSAFFLNLKTRTLVWANAQDEAGLTLTGTSISNLRSDTVETKKVDSLVDFFTSQATRTYTDLKIAFHNLSSPIAERKGIRLLEDIIILAVGR